MDRTGSGSCRTQGYTEAPPDARRQQEALRRARRLRRRTAGARAAEGPRRGDEPGHAAEYALMLTTPGPEQPQPPEARGRLSARERELVTLVAQGRTDAQIAAQLLISVRTVSTHLDRVRDKTGCRRRAT